MGVGSDQLTCGGMPMWPIRGGPAPKPVATVVILNWQRPSNVRAILDHYTAYRRVAEIIVWSNNADAGSNNADRTLHIRPSESSPGP